MADPPRLLDRVREAIRVRHYSRRTEEAYVAWIRRFILHHGKKHPAAMGADEVNAFLSHLAVAGKVSASTQAQALSALVFFLKDASNQTRRALEVREQHRHLLPGKDHGETPRTSRPHDVVHPWQRIVEHMTIDTLATGGRR